MKKVKNNTNRNEILSCKDVTKVYTVGKQELTVLKNISLTIHSGDFVVLFGPSGCGKSTLLHILLGLEVPTSGKVSYNANNLYFNLNDDDRAVLRKKGVGMIYQQPNWIKSLNVLENVAFPLILNGYEQVEANNIARNKLVEVSMEDWASHHPNELSSGQQQKVALARGITTDPMLVIADEPTGNLDYNSGLELMDLLTKLNSEGKTVVMVTHDLDYLSYANLALEMFDGEIINEYSNDEIESKILKPKLKKKEVMHHE